MMYLEYTIMFSMILLIGFHLKFIRHETPKLRTARLSHIALLVFNLVTCIYSLLSHKFELAWAFSVISMAMTPKFCPNEVNKNVDT